jgi:hypothetical protein
MRKPAKFMRYAAARGAGRADDDRRELALLAEFTRCDSVASLAGAIAERLGRKARSRELIEEAGLAPKERLAADGTELTGRQQIRAKAGVASMAPRR